MLLACRGTVGYAPARQQVNEAVRHDFAGAGEYVAVFEDLRKIYTAGQNWDFAAWSAGQRCSPCALLHAVHAWRFQHNPAAQPRVQRSWSPP